MICVTPPPCVRPWADCTSWLFTSGCAKQTLSFGPACTKVGAFEKGNWVTSRKKKALDPSSKIWDTGKLTVGEKKNQKPASSHLYASSALSRLLKKKNNSILFPFSKAPSQMSNSDPVRNNNAHFWFFSYTVGHLKRLREKCHNRSGKSRRRSYVTFWPKKGR